MSVQTYSRDYLQSIPEQRKQEELTYIVKGFIGLIQMAAAVGITSYIYVRPTKDNRLQSTGSPPIPVLTDKELVAGFQERFPGCKVFYEEAWVDSGRDTKTLKKGIVIDWS